MSRIKYLISKGFEPHFISMNKPFLLLQGRRGSMACRYIDIHTAEKSGDILCLFSGVSTFDEMLESHVVECTSHANNIGIKEGMLGYKVIPYIS